MSKEVESNRGNWMLPPTNRWAFKHITSILHMDQISRGSTRSVPISTLEDATSHASDGEIEGATYTAKDVDESDPGAAPTLVERRFAEMLERTHTDAIVVLHRGKIVYEKYFDGQVRVVVLICSLINFSYPKHHACSLCNSVTSHYEHRPSRPTTCVTFSSLQPSRTWV